MTDAPLDLKISMQIPDDQVEVLESYFYECEANPWVLIQKTAADPYFLNGYFSNEDDCAQAIAALNKNFPQLKLAFSKETLVATEWQNAYKQYVKPWNDRLLHWVPLWSKATYTIPKEGIPVYLDAGMAFGTGCHETTQLCASRLVDFYLSDTSKENLTLVDAGCGSGILALSARALGFQSIRGFDNDPDAIQVCHDHLIHNSTLEPIKFTVDDLISGLPEGSIDFLMANIQTNILIPFAEPILKSLRASAHLILSGILTKEIEELKLHYAKKLNSLRPNASFLIDSREKGEWSDLKIEIIACESEKII
jgi:ribosomal protein L11 methyltransferase